MKRFTRTTGAQAAVAMLLAGVAWSCQAAASYQVTDLTSMFPSPLGDFSTPTYNDYPTIGGSGMLMWTTTQTVVKGEDYRSQTFVDMLGQPPVQLPTMGVSTYGIAMDSHGDVVGEWNALHQPNRGFIWNASSGMQDLGSVLGHAISDDGSYILGGLNNDLLYKRGSTPQPIDGSGAFGMGSNVGVAVNNSGTVIGKALGSSQFQATVYSQGSGWSFLGGGTTPMMFSSQATAINDAGVVAGVMQQTSSSPQTAFVYDGHDLTPLGLGSGPSRVYALNDAGTVLGASDSGDWVWNAATGVRALSDLAPLPQGCFMTQMSMDQKGRILDDMLCGADPDHLSTKVLLLAPVPEPATASLMLVGLAGLAVRRRRRRQSR